MRRHRRNSGRYCASRSANAGAVEQNHFTLGRERIDDGRIPVVECPHEMLQAEQRAAGGLTEAAVRVCVVADDEELRRRVAGRHATIATAFRAQIYWTKVSSIRSSDRSGATSLVPCSPEVIAHALWRYT